MVFLISFCLREAFDPIETLVSKVVRLKSKKTTPKYATWNPPEKVQESLDSPYWDSSDNELKPSKAQMPIWF